MSKIIDLTKLNSEEYLVFITCDIDFIGNNVYNEYEIYKIDDEFYIKYEKVHHLKVKKYISEVKVLNLGSILIQDINGDKRETFIPNTIIEGCNLVGQTEDGFKINYTSIIKISTKERVPLLCCKEVV